MRNAIGVSKLIPESCSSACRIKLSSSLIDLLMGKSILLRFTIRTAVFRAKLISLAVSLDSIMNCFLSLCAMTVLNFFEDDSSSRLLVCSAYARDVYKCDMILKIHCAPSPSLAILLINFRMSVAQNSFLFLGHLRKSFLNWSGYSWGRPTVILFVLIVRPRTTCLGLIDVVHHFFRDRGHCRTSTLGCPQTVKMLSIVVARRFVTYFLLTPADRMSSTYMFPFGGIRFPSGWSTHWFIGQE
jgi:hypothetical protein